MDQFDFCVIGGGIVGLATAVRLLEQHPGSDVLVLEKEAGLARHQTGHNSGVIHSGIYYEPGSLKADLCRAGATATKRLATEHGIPVQTTGKLLVATNDSEMQRLAALRERAAINAIDVEHLDAAELRRREPAVVGLGALLVHETGIVDYTAISEALAVVIRGKAGVIRTGIEVTAIEESLDAVTVVSASGRWRAKRLIVCAGLQADRLATLGGIDHDFQIIPFRGEYFRLPESRRDLVKHLIYPVPDPSLPFLGVHLTRTVDGGITVGPNAVLGMAREKYARGSFDRRDVWEYVRFSGMWKVARQNVRTGAREMTNSLFVRGYLREVRKYCPELNVEDLLPEPAGIRAQAVRRDGTLLHDFLVLRSERTLHVCNAPSPAATAAFPIAEHIVGQLLSRT